MIFMLNNFMIGGTSFAHEITSAVHKITQMGPGGKIKTTQTTSFKEMQKFSPRCQRNEGSRCWIGQSTFARKDEN